MSETPKKPAPGHDGGSNSMWGGRFSAGPSAIMQAINASIGFDQKLWRQDIAGSRAHCRMLVAQGIIPAADGEEILCGLDLVEQEIAAGSFTFDAALEDIHMNVEARLKALIGEPAGRLHTARSRNDQVATDFRLWVRDTIDALMGEIRKLQRALVDKAEAHTGTVMPGYTHLQAAQPVTFGHHLLAYAEMLDRDHGRFRDARRRMNENPLGAGALAGTTYPIDRQATATSLGFDRPMANSLDAVSDRDFALEFMAAATICAVHLSRLAEEIVLWMNPQFGFVGLSDAFSTGSSMMPQKRNPDAAELVRGKTGRMIGNLTALLVALKGLPLTYSKDMQEDKEPVFDAAETLHLGLVATAGMIGDMRVNAEAMRKAASTGFTTATDLADWLVQALGIPFRHAHEITGKAVRLAEDRHCELKDLPLPELQKIEPRITADLLAFVTVEQAVTRRSSEGGTAPERVRAAVTAMRTRIEKDN